MDLFNIITFNRPDQVVTKTSAELPAWCHIQKFESHLYSLLLSKENNNWFNGLQDKTLKE